jgi:hypothetical protein
VAADDRRHRFPAALEGDEVELRGFDADRLGDEAEQQVLGAAREPAPNETRARVRLPVLDEVVHVL